jgi:hypothetical protein
MENTVSTAKVLTASLAGTYDFSNAVEQLALIDRAMRHYFNSDH